MNIGKLRYRMMVQTKIQSQDPNTGDIIEVWQNIKKIWASIQPLSVRDFIAASAEQSKISARIVIRADDSITPSMRLVYIKKSIAYEIAGILPDAETGEDYMTIAASTGVKVDLDLSEWSDVAPEFTASSGAVDVSANSEWPQ